MTDNLAEMNEVSIY